MRIVGVVCVLVGLLTVIVPVHGNDYRDTYYSDNDAISVEHQGRIVARLPCERIALEFPDLNGRAQANVALDGQGGIWAAVGYDVGGRGVERLFHSRDGGRTWTSRVLPYTKNLEIVAFTVLHDDTMLLSLNKHCTAVRDGLYVYTSRDRGKTWKLTTHLWPAPFTYIGEGFMSFTQLKDGRVLFPVTRWTDPGDDLVLDRRLIYHSVYVSEDGGKTFPVAHTTFWDFCEAHILELQSGKLLGAFRYQRTRRGDDTDESIEALGGMTQGKDKWIFKHVFFADSDDGAVSWKNYRPLLDREGKPLLKLSECHGQLVQVPDGRVVVAHDLRMPFDHGEIRARISRDEGQTWEQEVYHVSYGRGYASSVALADGTIVTVTGNTPYRAKPPYPVLPWRAQVIRWKLP